MGEDRDTEKLYEDMDGLTDLGDLGELEEFSDGDLDALLGEDGLSLENSGLDLGSEFDGLMDLADFEELDSPENASDLDGLFDLQTDNWEEDLDISSQENKEASVEQPDPIPEVETAASVEPEPTVEADLSASEESLSTSEEGTQAEAEIMDAVSEGENSEGDFIDLDAMAGEFPLEEEPQAEAEPQDEVQDVLDLAGADLQEQPSLTEIESVNDELLLDVPELDEKMNFKEKKEKKKKGVGFFQKLFGNVPDENAEKNAAKEAQRQAEKEAKKAAKKTKEEIALEKQEKQKAKEEAAAIKKSEQDAKKAQKAEQKKLKLEAKAAAKEARELEEAQEPPTRINRVGAGIIFATFAVIAVAIIAGNNSYAYSRSITRASTYFNQKEYTSAYNQIYGINVKKTDEELKNQVMTVMFIEKQRNSFDNYFAMEMYPEALDSLLKGLDKYDKYLEQARSLGIESDVNYVKDEILAELSSAFHISEKKAYKLLSISDPDEYTRQVVEAAGGN